MRIEITFETVYPFAMGGTADTYTFGHYARRYIYVEADSFRQTVFNYFSDNGSHECSAVFKVGFHRMVH